MEYGIKFRPIKPASPHLNGKVERSQRTDLEEFYPTVDIYRKDFGARLRDWQDYYDPDRVHGSLDGRRPWQVWYERAQRTPFFDEVEAPLRFVGRADTYHPGQPAALLTPTLRAKILPATRRKPKDGSTHWSCRKPAAAIHVSKDRVHQWGRSRVEAS